MHMPSFSHKKEPLFLIIGDIFFLFFSLWLTLLIRFGELPSGDLYLTHLMPFSILFVVWLLVFFIAGLYEKHTVILRSRLPATVFNAQLANTIIAVLFFYFIPFFNITPKTNLFIYLVVFFILTLTWRIYGRNLFTAKNKQRAMLVGNGKEMRELYDEVNSNNRYDLIFTSFIDLDQSGINLEQEIGHKVARQEIDLIVIDLNNNKVEPVLPTLYKLIFSNVQFVDMHKLYEEIFDRIPVTTIGYNWFLENVSTSPKIIYDTLKRMMDIVIALFFGTISLIFYPFVYIGTKIQDGGPLFIRQERVGENDKIIHILKFRSMTTNDQGNYTDKNTNKVTPFGSFLRKSRIDEFPQFWNIVKGDLSFVGPRPELPLLVREYEKQLPYYNVRHLIKPGLSGWAQIYHEQHPHHGIDTQETQNKLSYDLYYIKNRSIMLDIKVILRTFRTFLSRAGR